MLYSRENICLTPSDDQFRELHRITLQSNAPLYTLIDESSRLAHFFSLFSFRVHESLRRKQRQQDLLQPVAYKLVKVYLEQDNFSTCIITTTTRNFFVFYLLMRVLSLNYSVDYVNDVW